MQYLSLSNILRAHLKIVKKMFKKKINKLKQTSHNKNYFFVSQIIRKILKLT